MTTDITELAQSLKAAANREMICRDVAETSEIWERTVTPENILALVEALEKAHAVMNAVVTAAAIRGVRPFDGIDCDPPTLEENAEACGDAMSARIRELEANPPKPHHNGLMQISNELASAKQRIAELESRTVKLPAACADDEYFNDGVFQPMRYERDVERALRAAGIKWEAE